MGQHPAFREGWYLDWSGDPSRGCAWHVSGAYASVRGSNLMGMPTIRLDRQAVVNQATWDIEALRGEALALYQVGFDDQHPSLRAIVCHESEVPAPSPAAGAQCERRYWLTDIEAQRVDTLLQWLREPRS